MAVPCLKRLRTLVPTRFLIVALRFSFDHEHLLESFTILRFQPCDAIGRPTPRPEGGEVGTYDIRV
jgi:hypothetical protein